MKYLVLSDVHGRSLNPIFDLVDNQGFDRFFFLGDLDLMQSIRHVHQLQKKFETEHGGATLVPGNHDHALYANLDISSGALREHGTNMAMLHRELEHDEELYDFITQLVEVEDPDTPTPHSKQTQVNEFNTLLVHGGLAGSLHSFPDCPANLQDLWHRLRTTQHLTDNFTQMTHYGYDLLLRGHDHDPFHTSQHYETDPVHHTDITTETTITLARDHRHILSLGAYCDGWYTTITTVENNLPRVSFHQV